MDVLAAVRRAVGPAFLIGFRMVADEQADGGLTQEDGVEIARRLAASGQVDFLNVIRGHIETDEALSHVIPNMGAPAGPHLQLARALRHRIGLPVLPAGRIRARATGAHAVGTAALPTAPHAVEAGHVDLVGMTRAHLADPHIAAKLARGEEARIRPCVGAGYCIDRIYEGGEALCIHNPATGREETMPHVIARASGPPRKTVVVGAGPAGREAARVAAERGHAVTVLEAASRAGGQLLLAAALERRREMSGIADWRLGELERLGVRIRYNTLAEPSHVLAE